MFFQNSTIKYLLLLSLLINIPLFSANTIGKIFLILNSLNDLYFYFFLFSLSHKDEFTIIPVLVGALSESKEQEFGKLFSKYLADPSNLFVVSSDFCHWGKSQILTYRRCYVFYLWLKVSFHSKLRFSILLSLFTKFYLQQPCLKVNKQPFGHLKRVRRGDRSISKGDWYSWIHTVRASLLLNTSVSMS